MKNREFEQGNTYPLQLEQVQMTPEASAEFSENVREAIDEAFLFSSHREVLKSVQPLKLVPLGSEYVYRALTNNTNYNQVYVEATFDHDGGDSFLNGATIKLRNEWVSVLRADIVIAIGDDDIEEEEEELINIDEPAFYIETAKEHFSLERESIPLNYIMCRTLLNHIVLMTNPIAAATNPNRTIQESIEALLSISEETTINRSMKYSFRPSDDEQFIVDVRDEAIVRPLQQPEHTSHHANVKRIRSFGRAGLLTTALELASTQYGNFTTIEKEFSYDNDTADEIKKRAQEVSEEHGSLSVDMPEVIMTQIINGVHMLRSTLSNSGEIDRLES